MFRMRNIALVKRIPFNKMRLIEQENHLWQLQWPYDESLHHLLPLLDESEKQKYQRYHRQSDSMRYLAGHAYTKILLALYHGNHPLEYIFSANETGKPVVSTSQNQLEFNISHSGEMVIIGFSKKSLGVDVEEVKPLKDMEELSQFILRPEELSRFYRVHESQKLEHFYRYWVMKEAYLKSVGCGLCREPASISVTYSENNAFIVLDTQNNCQFTGWWHFDGSYCYAAITL